MEKAMRSWVKLKYCSNMPRIMLPASSRGFQVTRPAGSSISASATASIDGNSTPFFKGLITAIERSNPGFIWNWDENSLKGKLFGGVFGREEYMGTDGKPRWSCKVRFVRSVEGVEDVSAPEDKPLSNHPAQPAYGDYAALAQSHSSAGIGATNLPF